MTRGHASGLFSDFYFTGMMGFACVELSLTADSLVFSTEWSLPD